MLYEPNNIADFFISQVNSDSGDTISHLKLQKLVYYAQAWHYTIFGCPLFNERVEAWMHGPVIRSIYDRFKDSNVYTPLNIQEIELNVPIFPQDTFNILIDINTIYGEHSGAYLENLTHNESPWLDARAGIPDYERCDNEITLEAMKNYYSKINERQD